VHAERPSTELLVRQYLAAKRAVIEAGYAEEIAWQATAQQRPTFAPPVFASEAAWVVLSAGMRESVVRCLFEDLSDAMYQFDPVALPSNRRRARSRALHVFDHPGKIDAILDIAATAGDLGEAGLRQAVERDAEMFLRSLPYVGPVTWRHLAKNLGMPIAKPDRHLVRVVEATGRASVDSLCDEISAWLGEAVSVVDIVLWRWSVLHSSHCTGDCNAPLHNVS
jgi:hypothetical protein